MVNDFTVSQSLARGFREARKQKRWTMISEYSRIRQLTFSFSLWQTKIMLKIGRRKSVYCYHIKSNIHFEFIITENFEVSIY